MTIYFAGTERDAIPGGTVTTSTTYFDSNYSLSALLVNQYASLGPTLTDPAGADDPVGWWLQAHYAWGSRVSPIPAGVGWTGMVVRDLNSNIAARAYGTNDGAWNQGSNIRLQVYNAAGASAYVDMDAILSPGKFVFTLRSYTNGSGNAVAEFYIDNVLKGQAMISSVSPNRGGYAAECFGGWYYNTNISNTYYAWDAGISELIFADESTLGMRVKTYRPTADGTHITWDGNFENVNNDEIGLEAISTKLPNAAETFLHGQTLTEGATVRAVVIGANIASANPTDASAVLNIGGTLYQKSFEKLLTQGTSPNLAIYETNPATGVSFTAADFNSLEFGVQHS